MNFPLQPSRSSRRQLLRLGAGIGASLALPRLAAAKGRHQKEKPFQGQTLRLFVYSGAWEATFREAFVGSFQEHSGAKVIVDPGWWDSIPKLKASPKGQPAFDLVLTDATQGYPAIREGMFRQLDLERIPNVKGLSPSVLDHWVYKERYGITFPESAMTLAWNKNLVPFEPKGWGDLLKDELRGKLGLYNSFYMSLFTFACMKVAAEGRAGQAAAEMDKDLAGVLAFAKERRELVKYWWPTSTDMVLNLSQKNCALGNMHSPDILPALRQKPELGALVPAEDRAFVLLMWVVPSDTPRSELAHAAIDHILAPEFQREFARRGSATAIPAVAAEVAAQDPVWKQIYPASEEQLKAVRYYPYDAYFKDWDGIVKTWDQEILRKG